MGDDTDRRAELMGAALAGELTPTEQEELAALARRDPSVDTELADLQGLLGRVGAADVTWVEAAPDDDLAERVADLGSTGSQGRSRSQESGRELRPRPLRRPRLAQILAAACLVGIGVLGTLGYQWRVHAPPSGPPGTLGAVEEISFSGAPGGSDVEGALVAHTWGTETVLEIDGLEVGETFEVVLVTRSGEELGSGAFVGSEATVECRMNAAVMREDVTQVRIDSSDGGSVHLVADLPAVEALG